MKKILLVLALPLLLVGCGSNKSNSTSTSGSSGSSSEDTKKLNIVSPTGAPSFAFYNELDNVSFETNSTPSNIVAMMSEKSDKDIVVIDTTSGLKAINNGAPYKIAASITFGNFFIASTGNDDNSKMEADDKIVLFGEHQTPDLLFHYLYGNTYDANIEYVTNVQDAAKCLITGKNNITGSTIDYVFVAQPVLYNALQKNKNAAKYADIQEQYRIKSGGKSLIQASLFVKNTASTTKVNNFLTSLRRDIEDALSNPDLISEKIKAKYEEEEALSIFGVDSSIAATVIKDNNGMGLGFEGARDIKDQIDSYISLFSMEETNEEIYF